jgi:hypothetical protein
MTTVFEVFLEARLCCYRGLGLRHVTNMSRGRKPCGQAPGRAPQPERTLRRPRIRYGEPITEYMDHELDAIVDWIRSVPNRSACAVSRRPVSDTLQVEALQFEVPESLAIEPGNATVEQLR